MIKPSIPKGTRDFGPEELYKREYIFSIIKEVFQKFGYQPIETPAMENLTTLTGKYGEEGDKLLFKILNNGDFLSKADEQALVQKDSAALVSSICDRGLRYDLTIPFARFVVMNQHKLTFPFKRYQIQPVWRADRPQKGRYREFYQCDADVVGSDSLLNEVELVQIYDEVFTKLGIDVTIKVNNRKILAGMAEVAKLQSRAMELSTVLDKLDKIGIEGVQKELAERGFDSSNLKIYFDVIATMKDFEEYFQESLVSGISSPSMGKLDDLFKHSETGKNGLNELYKIWNLKQLLNFKNKVEFDPYLARGLDYYTGTIFEVTANDAQMGSIGGGGRYDDLTGVFGLKGVSGVGISFGAERIYDVMEELGLFENKKLPGGTMALFVNFGGEKLGEKRDEKTFEEQAFLDLMELRNHNISSELYPTDDKVKKQLKYADQKKIQFVIFKGEEEIKAGKLKVKEMETGEENLLTLEQLIQRLQTA